MKKVSVIVPVYNTEKYIEKCLNSILSQKNVEIEIIVVNDGSTDNSDKILKKFENEYPDKIKIFEKNNGGLSDARNFGISKATGDYICFVDSDDYIDEKLFETMEQYMIQEIELIKYKCLRVDENGKHLEKVGGPVFKKETGNQAFNILYGQDVLLETAWLYLYKRDFFEKNNFFFPINKYHEDWAIVPFIIISAKSVVSTDFYGYYYVQSQDSITRNNNSEKIRNRAYDMLEHYDNYIKKLSQIDIDMFTSQNFKIYMSNCLILKLDELPKEYHEQYIRELKKRKIFDNIKVRNFKQLIKKILLKINVKLYLKIR